MTSPETFSEKFRFSSWGVSGDAGRCVFSVVVAPHWEQLLERMWTWVQSGCMNLNMFLLFICCYVTTSQLISSLSSFCFGLQSSDIILRLAVCISEIFLLWLFNTRLFVLKWKRFSLYSPRNQPDNSSTLLHFSASHLLFVPSASPFLPSFVSIPRLLPPTHAVNLVCQQPRQRGWYHLIVLLSERGEAPVPALLRHAYFWFRAGYQVLAQSARQQLCPPGGVWIKQPARSQFAGEFVSEPQGSWD